MMHHVLIFETPFYLKNCLKICCITNKHKLPKSRSHATMGRGICHDFKRNEPCDFFSVFKNLIVPERTELASYLCESKCYNYNVLKDLRNTEIL